MPEQLDDNAVIQQVLQGNQAAYAILVDRYQGFVFTLVLRYVNNRETAEELAQDVFVKAYRFLADFKGNSKFSTWLYTIVNNTCLSHLRNKPSDTITVNEEQIINLAGMAADKPASDLDQKLTKQLLAAAMKHLPREEEQTLNLHYMAGQSVEEIGIITGTTSGNVKVRLFRARQKLKKIIEAKYRNELM